MSQSMQEILQSIEDTKRDETIGTGFSEETVSNLESQAPGISEDKKTVALEEVKDQKARALAQGLTFGFADELEGFIRSLGNQGVSYEQARDQVRKEVADYQAAKPGEALTYEIIGAVAPTVASLFAGPTGWANAMRTITQLGSKLQGRSSIAQVAHMSGKQTALYSVGKGEDGLIEDIANAPGSYVLGATIGGTVQGATQGLTEVMSRLASTEIGSKFKKPVRDALEKMIEKTGKTAQQIVDEVRNGKLLVENDTLRAAIKALTTKAGSANAIIRDTLKPRVSKTKTDLLDTMGESIGVDWKKNLRTLYDDNDKVLAKAESEAYGELFDTVNPKITEELKKVLLTELKATGSDASSIEKAISDLMRRKKLTPLLKAHKNGSFKFTRAPTLKDAEFIYRLIRDLGGKYKREGANDAAADFTQSANLIKKSITDQSTASDDAYALLTGVRETAKNRRIGIEAYEYGVKKATAPGTMSDDLQVMIDQYKNVPGAFEQLRLGVMRAIKHKKDTNQNKNIAMEDANLQKAISMIFPEESIDDIIAKADIATGAKETLQSINYGTTTSQEQQALDIFGKGLNSVRTGENQDMGLSLVRGAYNIITARNRELSTAEAEQLARLVVSEDADLVKRALVDEVELNKLASLIDSLIYGTGKTVASGTSKIGGSAIEEERGDLGLMDIATGYTSDIVGNLMQQN